MFQVIGFHLMLIVFGLIISTAALVDPHHKRSAPRVGFSLVIAPVCAIVLPVVLAPIVPSSMPIISEFVLVFGYVAGVAGGIWLGQWLGARHKRHLINSCGEADHGADSDES